MKKGCLGCLGFIVVIIIIIAIISMIAGGDDSKSSSGGKSSSKSNSEKTYQMGEVVKVDGVEFTINNISTATQVGSNGLEENAKGEYVILDTTVKNTNDESLNMDSSYFKLIDGSKTSEADMMASTTANQENSPDNTGFLGESINPGNEQTAKVVFDVSSDVANSTDKVIQVQSGIFGTKTAKIQVN
ncbi:hypothetical protein BU062_05485 [Staphylococcus succinus]|uniref:DUF4352 domain-containing protein n=1 Tax=Staphylococcus succinus TaxID=61015 RepID=UPI000D1E4CDD|nr:DUF4352 domain-containing protein [Staphylococcus succinus]PTI42852.1 hypothetical protein BU062_05485 [Staphylococcus succinus]